MDKNIVVIGGEYSEDITRMTRIDEAERRQEGSNSRKGTELFID